MVLIQQPVLMQVFLKLIQGRYFNSNSCFCCYFSIRPSIDPNVAFPSLLELVRLLILVTITQFKLLQMQVVQVMSYRWRSRCNQLLMDYLLFWNSSIASQNSYQDAVDATFHKLTLEGYRFWKPLTYNYF